MTKHFTVLIAFLMSLSSTVGAASNEETLQYIISDYQDQCVKAQEDFRDIDYKEGDPVVAELELSADNIYEIIIDKDISLFARQKPLSNWMPHLIQSLRWGTSRSPL